MAEFQEVMKQFHRMCKFYQLKRLCPMGCPMDGLNVSQCRKQITDAYDDVEYIIMKWAAEHPESITVYEWLVSLGLLSADMWSISDLHKPIPADIAQKLGIEPKEAKCDETT